MCGGRSAGLGQVDGYTIAGFDLLAFCRLCLWPTVAKSVENTSSCDIVVLYIERMTLAEFLCSHDFRSVRCCMLRVLLSVTTHSVVPCLAGAVSLLQVLHTGGLSLRA
jgi:hypothetical protein